MTTNETNGTADAMKQRRENILDLLASGQRLRQLLEAGGGHRVRREPQRKRIGLPDALAGQREIIPGPIG